MTICPICSKMFKGISYSHIMKTHNMTIEEFRNKYPNVVYGQKGKKMSVETRKRVSDSHKGQISSKKGKTFEQLYGEEKATELKNLYKKNKLGKTYVEMYGEERAKEISSKISDGNSGKICWSEGKTYVEMYGEERAKEISSKISAHNTGKVGWLAGKTYEDVFGKEVTEKKKKEISELFSGSGNPMHQISVKNIWTEKYGEEIAEQMWEERYKNANWNGKKISGSLKKYYEAGNKNWNFGKTSKTDCRIASGKRNGMFGKPCPERKRTFYKNIWFKSTWEALFAYDMDLNGIKWEYEKFRIQIVEGKTYCPDFVIYDEDHRITKIIEIKGWKNGSEVLPKILQKCCRVPVELWDEQKMKEHDIFKHKKLVKFFSKRQAVLDIPLSIHFSIDV